MTGLWILGCFACYFAGYMRALHTSSKVWNAILAKHRKATGGNCEKCVD